MPEDNGSAMAQRNKVLMLLSNPFRPDPRVHREAVSLIRNGYDVTIVCWDRDRKHHAKETIDGIKLIRVGPAAGWGESSGFILALRKFWKNLGKAASGLEYDIVHAHDLDTLSPGLKISARKKVPLIYDSHEIYYEMAGENISGFLLRYLTRYEAKMVRRPKIMITVNEPIADIFRGFGARDVRVVMNCQPEVRVDAAEAKNIRSRISPDGKPIVLYIGVLEPNRLLLELAQTHSSGKEDFVLAMGGYGSLEGQLKAVAGKSNGRVSFIGRVRPSEVPAHNMASDILLATYDPGLKNNRMGAPNKLFEAMMISRPIIVSKGTYAAEVAENTGCGIPAEYDAGQVLSTARDLLADRKRYIECARAGRKAYEGTYNWPANEKILLRAYSDLLAD